VHNLHNDVFQHEIHNFILEEHSDGRLAGSHATLGRKRATQREILIRADKRTRTTTICRVYLERLCFAQEQSVFIRLIPSYAIECIEVSDCAQGCRHDAMHADAIACIHQTHGSTVKRLTPPEYEIPLPRSQYAPYADAAITYRSNVLAVW